MMGELGRIKACNSCLNNEKIADYAFLRQLIRFEAGGFAFFTSEAGMEAQKSI
jgi:hypothetical protein